jgi:hypothetical protein
LNPTEDFYDLWLGAAFLDKANTQQQTPSILSNGITMDALMNMSFENIYQLNQADSLIAAQAVLQYARALNPLNTDHSANLARLHRRWADLKASDPAARQQELEASAEYYRQATSLSPDNAQSGMNGRWSIWPWKIWHGKPATLPGRHVSGGRTGQTRSFAGTRSAGTIRPI